MVFEPICIILIVRISVLNATQPRPEDNRLSWNPLYALDWPNINLFDQISDDFINNNGEVEFRSHSGVGNNINNPRYGSANTFVPRCLPAVYGDGFNSMTGETRMNPREISNVLSRQLPENDPIFVNNRDLTQFAWQWGQFIDHDITLISEDKSALDLDDDIDIYVPCGDPEFDAFQQCDASNVMEVFRTKSNNTGSSPINIREQINENTAFIDASMIYGSDDERAIELRTFQDGKMKMSDQDDNLPKNINRMVNEPNNDSRFFIGGDVRVNEQLGLLTMHTIWVRAHNIISEFVSDSIRSRENHINIINEFDHDEMVYQYTKLLINAIIQKIVYKDWLPTLFGPSAIQMFLGNYNEYNDSINPGICPIFTSAAYRLGHTFLPQKLPLRNPDCTFWHPIDLENNCPNCIGGGIELKNTFFIPEIVENTDGFYDALLNGYACTKANEVDTFVTEGVRNFLYFSSVDNNNQRLFGDLDLVAINLQRGREHGLPDYNSVRQQLGLNKLINFNEITSNNNLSQQFYIMYKENINDIDLFLGGLAEDHFSDGSFGETISSIVLGQFKKLRDGDRFFYENYIKPGKLLDFINCMTLKSIIELTTDINNIDSIRHNMFQNARAISIFDGTDEEKKEKKHRHSSERKKKKKKKKEKNLNAISEFENDDYGNASGENRQIVLHIGNSILMGSILILNVGLFCYCVYKK